VSQLLQWQQAQALQQLSVQHWYVRRPAPQTVQPAQP
jgi:hypothetical protein